MDLSISNIAWNNEDESEIASLLSSYSVNGVEVAPTKVWSNPLDVNLKQVHEYRSFWGNKGLEIVAMQSLLFGRSDLTLFENPEIREQLKVYLKKIIELAGQLGAKALVFGSPKNRIKGNMSYANAMNIAIPFFHEIGTIAIENNVQFCIEPNPTQYHCDFIVNTNEGIELVKEVNHRGIMLHLDAAALSLAGDHLYDSIERSIPYLAHFHISEPYLELIGNGSVNHKEIASALNDTGYDKWISIEMKNNLLSSNVDAVRKTLDFVRKTYRLKKG